MLASRALAKSIFRLPDDALFDGRRGWLELAPDGEFCQLAQARGACIKCCQRVDGVGGELFGIASRRVQAEQFHIGELVGKRGRKDRQPETLTPRFLRLAGKPCAGEKYFQAA